MEATTYRSDGSESIHDVPMELAKTVGYFSLDNPHPALDPSGARERIKVRPYQLEGIQSIQDHREKGNTTALLHVATGLGKTTMDAMDAFQFEQYRKRRGTTRHIFAAHRTELVHQAMLRYQQYFPNGSYSILTGDRKDDVRPTTKYTFATLQTLQNMQDTFRPDWWHRMTIDESHHAPADSFNATIRYFTPEFLLGITGTPFRNDERELSDIFGETVYSMSLAQGIVEGWLVKLQYKLFVDGILEDVMGQDFKSVEALNRALFVPRRNEEIAKIVKQEQRRHANPRTLGFCRDTEHADLMADLLPEAAAIHASLPKRDRSRLVKAFRDGALPTAMTIDMFIEGVDIPETSILAYLRSMETRGTFEQSLGRGMRAAEGKECLTVLDFVGNSERLFMLHRLAKEIQSAYHSHHSRPNMSEDELEALDRRSRNYTGDMGLSFKEQEIAIIERMQEIANAPMRPKGWGSIYDLAKACGVHYPKMVRILADLRLEGSIMQNSKGNRGLYYSPLQQTYVAVAMEYSNSMKKWPSVSAAAEEFDMTAGGVREALKRLGRPPRSLLLGSTVQVISPEDIVALRNDQKLGCHVMSLAEIARRGNSSPEAAKKVIKDLKIVGEMSSTRARTKYNAEDSKRVVERLRALEAEKEPLQEPPPGFRAVAELKDLEEYKGMRYALKSLGIEPKVFIGEHGYEKRYLSPAEQKRIRELLAPPPEDHLSFAEAGRLYGIRDTRVARLVEQHGLKTTDYAQRFQKMIRPHLGPEELDKLALLAAQPVKLGRPKKSS